MTKKIRDWFAAGDDAVAHDDPSRLALAVLLVLALVAVAGGV